jgi:ribonuclease Y
MNPIGWIIISVIFLILGAAAGYFFHLYQANVARRNQQDKADNILKGASEQARLIESQARENAVKIVQAAETELKERRIELNKETERLDKRRTELDSRVDRLEQREQAINKRQSQVDRRGNEIDKLYEEQVKKLEFIAQMTQEDARKTLCCRRKREARRHGTHHSPDRSGGAGTG